MTNKRTITLPDGYSILLELDATDSTVRITMCGPNGWTAQAVTEWHGNQLNIIQKHRTQMRQFHEELMPEFEALCEVTQVVADLSA